MYNFFNVNLGRKTGVLPPRHLYEERNVSLDMAKGIAILMVVIGHLVNDHSFIGTYIYSYHMALFFIISGMCFNKQKYPSFIPFLLRRLRYLGLPLILFSVIYVSAEILLISRNITYMSLTKGFPGALWFVGILLLTELLFFPIAKFGIKIHIVFIIICGAIGYYISYQDWGIPPFSISALPSALSFYAFGHCISTRYKQITCKNVHNNKSLAVALLLLFLPLTAYYTNYHIFFLSCHAPVWFYLMQFTSSVGLLIMASRIYYNPLVWLGRNTFVLMAFHMLFIGIIHKYLYEVIPYALVYKIVEAAAVFILSILTCSILNCCWPTLLRPMKHKLRIDAAARQPVKNAHGKTPTMNI